MTTGKLAALNVMIVDDEEFSRKFLVRVLEAAGVGRVIATGSGSEALERLKGLGRDDVDIVITDIEMPDMGGFELSRRLRYGQVPEFKEVPIMILSGHFTDENVRYARTHKVDALLSKPPSVDVLKLEIEAVLNKRGG